MGLFSRRPTPDKPGPGQESVWDYPRPPRLETCSDLIEIYFGGVRIAHTARSWRILETSHPPTYYLPRAAFAEGALRPTDGNSWCEWKGRASYFDVLAGGEVAPRAAWTYVDPVAAYAATAGAIAVMPGRMERCLVNGEVVTPQPGEFYGGWITSRVVGPFKGGPGTQGW
jgi:uncharacterized protein (DUF427 family)